MDESSFPKVTIVIPNWNTQQWLPGCLDGLQAQTYQNFEIIVVDNGSTDQSVEFIKKQYPDVKLIAFKENRGFAPAVNAGIQHVQTEYIVLLNVDTIPQPDWLKNLIGVIEQSPASVAGVASKMLSMDDPTIIDDAGNEFSWYGSANKRGLRESADNYTVTEEVFSVSGGASLFRRSFFDDVGYFDESFISYLEDVDLGLRGRLLGYQFMYAAEAKIKHRWSGARIPRPQYVYLSTRNRLALLLKNIPGPLLIKHLPSLLYGQIYFFIAYKKPLHSLKGLAAFFRDLTSLLKKRYMIQKRKSISNQMLDSMLTHELYEPPLSDIIKNKIKQLSNS